jgi:hypothetical protein
VAGNSYVSQVRHGFVWIAPNGPMRDLGVGYVNAIDMAGATIAGEDPGTYPALWTLGGDGITWSAPVRLPVGPNVTVGTAQAIGSDPVTGRAILVSGSQTIPQPKNKGTIVAGQHNGVSAFWTATVDPTTGRRTWSGPFHLPDGCGPVMGIDNSGNISGAACPSNSRGGPAVWRPPYTSYTLLGGLGNSTNAGSVGDMSPNGFIVGWAPTGVPNSVTVGAYWTILSQ